MMGRSKKVFNKYCPQKILKTFVHNTNSIYFKQPHCRQGKARQGRSTNHYVTDPKQSIPFGTLFFAYFFWNFGRKGGVNSSKSFWHF